MNSTFLQACMNRKAHRYRVQYCPWCQASTRGHGRRDSCLLQWWQRSKGKIIQPFLSILTHSPKKWAQNAAWMPVEKCHQTKGIGFVLQIYHHGQSNEVPVVYAGGGGGGAGGGCLWVHLRFQQALQNMKKNGDRHIYSNFEYFTQCDRQQQTNKTYQANQKQKTHREKQQKKEIAIELHTSEWLFHPAFWSEHLLVPLFTGPCMLP